MFTLTLKKIGNHWYPDINHSNPTQLKIDYRFENILDKIDKYQDGEVRIYFYEQIGFVEQDGLLQFDDDDLCRLFTTNDSFIMNLYINNHKYSLSSELYMLLETNFHLDLHEIAYRINLADYEIED